MIRALGYRHIMAWGMLFWSAGSALAFDWSPEIIRPGDQRCLVEVQMGDAPTVFHVEIALPASAEASTSR